MIAPSQQELKAALHRFTKAFDRFQAQADFWGPPDSPLGDAVYALAGTALVLQRAFHRHLIKSGVDRARQDGTRLGRPPLQRAR